MSKRSSNQLELDKVEILKKLLQQRVGKPDTFAPDQLKAARVLLETFVPKHVRQFPDKNTHDRAEMLGALYKCLGYVRVELTEEQSIASDGLLHALQPNLDRSINAASARAASSPRSTMKSVRVQDFQDDDSQSLPSSIGHRDDFSARAYESFVDAPSETWKRPQASQRNASSVDVQAVSVGELSERSNRFRANEFSVRSFNAKGVDVTSSAISKAKKSSSAQTKMPDETTSRNLDSTFVRFGSSGNLGKMSRTTEESRAAEVRANLGGPLSRGLSDERSVRELQKDIYDREEGAAHRTPISNPRIVDPNRSTGSRVFAAQRVGNGGSASAVQRRQSETFATPLDNGSRGSTR